MSRVIDIAYWDQVKAGGTGAAPAGRPLPELLAELESMLAVPDAHVRDELGFDILGDWVMAGVVDGDLAGLGDRMAAALRAGLGDSGTDSVFGRSFAALILGLAVERDNITGRLDSATVRGWCAAGAAWLAAERDLRGVTEPLRGVAHAMAHAADLFASLARSRHTDTAHAQALLDTLTGRLAATGGMRLALSEDERLAYATMALLHRGDIGPDRLRRALAPLAALGAVRHRTDLDPRAWSRLNALDYLRALCLQLECGVRPMPWYAADGHFTRPPADRAALREAVLDALRPFSLWFAEPATATADAA